MKYNYSNETIPQDQRKDINTKIEYIVNNNLSESETGISKDDILQGLEGCMDCSFPVTIVIMTTRKRKQKLSRGNFSHHTN